MSWMVVVALFVGAALGFMLAAMMCVSRDDPFTLLEARDLIEDALDEGCASDPAWRQRAATWLEEA